MFEAELLEIAVSPLAGLASGWVMAVMLGKQVEKKEVQLFDAHTQHIKSLQSQISLLNNHVAECEKNHTKLLADLVELKLTFANYASGKEVA